jgi:predicted NAD/FAD-binding protein
MSFGVSTMDGAFEWGSYSFRSFVGSLSLLTSVWFWRLVFDVLRFSLFAEDILHEVPSDSDDQDSENNFVGECAVENELESIGQYLDRQRYSEQFVKYFLIPMVAAPWCIDPEEFARTFPAKPLISFM